MPPRSGAAPGSATASSAPPVRPLSILAEIAELRCPVDCLLDFTIALHFEQHAAGHDPERGFFVTSRLERHPRVEVPFRVLDPTGDPYALQRPQLAFDELRVELLLVLKRPGQV